MPEKPNAKPVGVRLLRLFRRQRACRPHRDSNFIPPQRDPADMLDNAATEMDIGTKLGLDAT